MEEDIEGLKRLFYANALTQYGKRKLISYYEQRYKELEEENAMLKKAHNISEKVTVEDITQVMNKSLEDFKKEFIPTSVIQKKIEKVNNSNGYSPVTKIFVEKVLNEILEEGRK